MDALRGVVNMESFALAKTLLCFCTDDVSTFHASQMEVTLEIQTKYASFALGVHYMDHRCNLAFKTLFELDIMSLIEGLLNSLRAYFKHSPKIHHEFIKFVELMKTKGLKLLKDGMDLFD